MSVSRLSLDARGPFDWQGALAWFAPRAIPGVEQVRDGRYRRRFENDGAEATFSVGAIGDRGLRVSIEGALPPAALAPRLRRMFDLDADLPAITNHLKRDPRLAGSLGNRFAPRAAGAFDAFELAVRAILGQQVSVAAATLLAGRLVARCARCPAPSRDDGLAFLFPRPRDILSADLSDMGMPGARVRSILHLSEAAGADPALLAPSGDHGADVERLKALPGIGEWTAQYIALRALGHRDAFPASDIGLLRAMSVDGVRPSPAELEEIAEAWRPYRGHAAMLLWSLPAGAGDSGSGRKATRSGSKRRRGEAGTP